MVNQLCFQSGSTSAIVESSVALVALMLLNGLRSREALGLRLEDLQFEENQLWVRGKGARVRVLPTSDSWFGVTHPEDKLDVTKRLQEIEP